MIERKKDYETETEKELKKEQYNRYVKEVTPKHNCLLNMFNAFWGGGLICVGGQLLMNLYSNKCHLQADEASTWVSITLILISVLLTGTGLYPKIAKLIGAGALVPITGFANGIAASAIEFKAEGEVYGKGAKIFNIAGPVILYGVLTSWLLGLVYWIGKMVGIVS